MNSLDRYTQHQIDITTLYQSELDRMKFIPIATLALRYLILFRVEGSQAEGERMPGLSRSREDAGTVLARRLAAEVPDHSIRVGRTTFTAGPGGGVLLIVNDAPDAEGGIPCP